MPAGKLLRTTCLAVSEIQRSQLCLVGKVARTIGVQAATNLKLMVFVIYTVYFNLCYLSWNEAQPVTKIKRKRNTLRHKVRVRQGFGLAKPLEENGQIPELSNLQAPLSYIWDVGAAPLCWPWQRHWNSPKAWALDPWTFACHKYCQNMDEHQLKILCTKLP